VEDGARLVDRMRRLGHAEDADRIRFADGPLRPLEEDAGDAEKLAALRAIAPRTAGAPGPSRADLVRIARGGGAEEARQALSKLAESPDAELGALLLELLGDRRPRIRLHAHRLLRSVVDRATYLRASAGLLTDPLPDVVRSAVRIVAFARWLPAVPAIVDLLLHAHPSVQRAAAEGLAQVGEPAIPALVSARAHARPDRRAVYDEVLARIGDA
jgi:HEAT repeat protein